MLAQFWSIMAYLQARVNMAITNFEFIHFYIEHDWCWNACMHVDVITLKHSMLLVFCEEEHCSLDLPHTGPAVQSFHISWLWAWTNCWTNSHFTSDLRPHGIHLKSWWWFCFWSNRNWYRKKKIPKQNFPILYPTLVNLILFIYQLHLQIEWLLTDDPYV